MLGCGLVARFWRAVWSPHRVQQRLRRYCRRSTALGELRRAWRTASEAARVAFLTEVEDLPS